MDTVTLALTFSFLAFGCSCAALAMGFTSKRQDRGKLEVWEPSQEELDLERDIAKAEQKIKKAREQTEMSWEEHERLFRELQQ